MWEIDLKTSRKNVQYLFAIEDMITKSQHHKKSVSYAYIEKGDTITMGIAILDPSKSLLDEIRKGIAEAIVLPEKEKYLTTKSIKNKSNIHSSLLKTIVFLDLADDIDYATKLVDLNLKCINLPSLFHFKMAYLRQKWDKILMSTLSKSVSNMSDEHMLDILKNIVTQNKIDIDVYIDIVDNKYIISTPSRTIQVDNLDEPDLIANLIIISPSSIILSQINIVSDDTLVLLIYLFGTNKIVVK